MGNIVTKLWNRLSGFREMRILLLGLDNAGKTTILYKLKLGQVISTIPTIGFNVESVKYRNVELNVWDVGGQEKIRPLWRYYYQNADALIFVVDSSDTGRLDESQKYEYNAKYELNRLLSEDELRDVVLLVYANKQDLPTAISVEHVAHRIGLYKTRGHIWNIHACNAHTGEGLYEGLDWLISALRKKKRSEQKARHKARVIEGNISISM